MNNNNLDDELMQMLENAPKEDPFITEYATNEISGEIEGRTMDMVENWFPEKEQIEGKTTITPDQARALALVKHMPDLFEELEDLDVLFEDIIQDYQLLLTSIGGESRREQASILRSIFGGPSSEEMAERNAFLKLFAGDIGEENE